METLIAHPTTKEQLNALKVLMKAMKIDFKISKDNYDPDFVAKIEQSKKDIKEGKGTRVNVEDLWK